VALPASSVRVSAQIHVSGKYCLTRCTSANPPAASVAAWPATVVVVSAAAVVAPGANTMSPSAMPALYFMGESISLPSGTSLLESTINPASVNVSLAPGMVNVSAHNQSASCSSACGCM